MQGTFGIIKYMYGFLCTLWKSLKAILFSLMQVHALFGIENIQLVLEISLFTFLYRNILCVPTQVNNTEKTRNTGFFLTFRLRTVLLPCCLVMCSIFHSLRTQCKWLLIFFWTILSTIIVFIKRVSTLLLIMFLNDLGFYFIKIYSI